MLSSHVDIDEDHVRRLLSETEDAERSTLESMFRVHLDQLLRREECLAEEQRQRAIIDTEATVPARFFSLFFL